MAKAGVQKQGPSKHHLVIMETRAMIGMQEFVTYPPNSSIRLWHGTYADHYEPHWHSAVEVLLPLAGECTMAVEGKDYRVKVDEILIVPSDKVHALTMGENSRRDLLLFELDSILMLRDFSVLRSLLGMPIHLTPHSQQHAQAKALLAQICAEYRSGKPLSNLICYARILELYAWIGRTFLDTLHANAPLLKQQTYWDVFNRIMAYIDANFIGGITLERVAAEAGFSKFYFTRLFKQYTNTTFYQFLTLKRVLTAERYLASTDLTVSEIALQAGFDSISSFNRVYKQLRGCTPSQYRRLHNLSAGSHSGF